MRRIMRSLALTGCIALLGTALTSCDAADRLAAPRDEVAPQYSSNGRSANSFEFLAPIPTENVSGEIEYEVEVDAAGSLLKLTGTTEHVVLYIQPGTVKRNTTFHISVTQSTTMMHVELTATSRGSAVVNDVGSRGFKKPVILGIDLSVLNVDGIDESRLSIAQLLPNGRVVPTYSVVHDGWLLGYLYHFSGWVPIAN